MRNEETELEKSALEFIEGEFITIKQSTVRSVEGGHVDLQQVGAFSIDGEKIDATQSASGILKGNEVHLNQSISAVTAADSISLDYSFAPLTISRAQATSSHSAVGMMAAREIASDNTSAFLVIANRVEGNMTTLLDWRSALALGAVAGGIWGLFSLLFRRK